MVKSRVPCASTTPGRIFSMPKMSRPLTWTVVSRSLVRFFCSALLVVWTGVTSAVTLTVSLTPPALSVSLLRSRTSPADRLTLVSTALKPSMVILTVQAPGGSATSRNTPCSLVTAVRTVPFAALVTVTVAPGTTPTLSTTVPLNVAVFRPCANAVVAPARQSNKAAQRTSRA